jgi:GlpG protein
MIFLKHAEKSLDGVWISQKITIKKLDIKNFHIPIILISVVIAIVSNFGSIISVIEPLTFLKFNLSPTIATGRPIFLSFNDTFTTNHEWWRLLTPMFIHFSFAHLSFNCLWIYVLGPKIETYDGHFLFILLIVCTSISANFAQYFFSGPSLFGGLSGVIYGMLGYCMTIEFEDQQERYDLPPALYLFMIVWLILGFIGILDLFGFGSVANFAHLGGLISGIIFAMITTTYKKLIKF